MHAKAHAADSKMADVVELAKQLGSNTDVLFCDVSANMLYSTFVSRLGYQRFEVVSAAGNLIISMACLAQGLEPFAGHELSSGETSTRGLEQLADSCAEYVNAGAWLDGRFIVLSNVHLAGVQTIALLKVAVLT
jgi:hypothetical protein